MWRQKVEQFLSTRKNRYRLVEHRSLVGIVLYVYVQEKHDRFVQDVQVKTFLDKSRDARKPEVDFIVSASVRGMTVIQNGGMLAA